MFLYNKLEIVVRTFLKISDFTNIVTLVVNLNNDCFKKHTLCKSFNYLREKEG